MATFSITTFIVAFQLLLALLPSFGVLAVPKPEARQASSNYWVAQINRQGTVAYGTSGYKVFRNVKDYGAKGRRVSLSVLRMLTERYR